METYLIYVILKRISLRTLLNVDVSEMVVITNTLIIQNEHEMKCIAEQVVYTDLQAYNVSLYTPSDILQFCT